MKNQLQKELYDLINPSSADDYFEKLSHKKEESELFKKLKSKSTVKI